MEKEKPSEIPAFKELLEDERFAKGNQAKETIELFSKLTNSYKDKRPTID